MKSLAQIKQSITRPADTNAYAAGDVVSTATSGGDSTLVFSGVPVPITGGLALLLNAMVISNAVPATPPDLELWLFDTSPTDQQDNAAFAPTDDELANNLIGVVPFSVNRDTANNRIFMADPDTLPLVLKCTGTAVRDIYGMLVMRSAYTPVSGEVFTVVLQVGRTD